VVRILRQPALVPAYLLGATPLFALADLLGAPAFRAAAMEGMRERMAYYSILMVLGLSAALRPRLAPWIGMGESVVNFTFLLLSILLPIWGLLDGPLAGDGILVAGDSDGEAISFGLAQAGNALLTGGMLILTFRRNQRVAFEGL